MKKKQAIHKEARSEAKKTGFKEFARKLHQKKAPRFLSSLFFNLTLPILGPYAYFVEPRRVQVTHTKVPIKNLGKGLENFKIVQMSDIHFGPTNKSPRFISKCVEKINKIKPDIKSRSTDGKLEERFSEAKWKEKNDLAEKLNKLDKALEEALGEKANYDSLKKAIA